MPTYSTLTSNAPVRVMDEGVLGLQSNTTAIRYENIRPNRARRKAR